MGYRTYLAGFKVNTLIPGLFSRTVQMGDLNISWPCILGVRHIIVSFKNLNSKFFRTPSLNPAFGNKIGDRRAFLVVEP